MSMPEDIVARAGQAGLRVTTAESCTGGMVAAALTDVPGSSAIFEQGFVTYSNVAKTALLGVNPSTLDATGAVSEQTAREMASGAAKVASAEIGIAITGIAGPGGSEFKPEGRVCFALCVQGHVISDTQDFGAIGRANVRRAARDHALRLVLDALTDRQM